MGLLVQTSFGVLAANESSATNVDTATDANFTNLIVFARFAGEEEFVNKEYHGLSVKEITDNSYNTATYSVGDYYRNASADQLRMNSVYLYDKGGSLQLTNQRGYYAPKSTENPGGYAAGLQELRRMELRDDWVNNPVSVSLLSGDRKPQIRF